MTGAAAGVGLPAVGIFAGLSSAERAEYTLEELVRLDEETRGGACPSNPLKRDFVGGLGDMSFVASPSSEVPQFPGVAAWLNDSSEETKNIRHKIARWDSGLVNGSKSGGRREKPIFAINPHPEKVSCDAVVVVHPGGMQVKAVSKFAVQNPKGGGVTGRRVTGRSQKARGRLMRHLISVDLGAVSSERKGAKFSRCLFVTLTYPWFEGLPFIDSKAGKAHIKALRKRIEAKYGLVWAVWVQESQESGALHYHFVLLLPNVVRVAAFRGWLAQAWYEVVGSENPDHLEAGTGAEPVYIKQNEPGSLLSYLSKELGGFGGKSYQVDGIARLTGEVLETGKTWGIWGRAEFESMKVVICVLRIIGGEAWQTFKDNVSGRFGKFSKYFESVSSMVWWGGGLLYGNGERLRDSLMDGIPIGEWGYLDGIENAA